jgi:hypothetical protein
MKVLDRPYTMKETKLLRDKDCFVSGVIAVDISDLLKGDFEEFLDLCSEKLTEFPCVGEIDYEIVGHLGNTIFLKVQGNVEMLDELDNEDGE